MGMLTAWLLKIARKQSETRTKITALTAHEKCYPRNRDIGNPGKMLKGISGHKTVRETELPNTRRKCKCELVARGVFCGGRFRGIL